jgi:predicted acetyltransferase
MDMDIEVRLVAATRADAPVVERLLQLYEYDYSEYAAHAVDVDARGLFTTVDTEAIWRPGYRVFLIEAGGKVAGFAFVTRDASHLGDDETWAIDEFFVLRRYRRQGVGERAARDLFDGFPGRWEVSELRENVAAQAFWRRVIDRYTGGRYREVELDDERWRGPVQGFEAPAAASER